MPKLDFDHRWNETRDAVARKVKADAVRCDLNGEWPGAREIVGQDVALVLLIEHAVAFNGNRRDRRCHSRRDRAESSNERDDAEKT